ncbi:GGDEF domain-containing protein [Leptospira ilyithenensis]|uniref:diguanylate cyclase n=1 Tax=Leptospira ilyithenensis TaxID=2484901 RepID=A0A4R9LSP2_9LEPT|nr:GGDEF domain-containing protein [Leptospira ilyithenensis]TGN11693.1 GGDEF domain-containing protein [Leptospira ilyithenensis]
MKYEKEIQDATALLDVILNELLNEKELPAIFTKEPTAEDDLLISQLLYLLTNINFPAEESRDILKRSFELTSRLIESLGRPVDFRVALLDILLSKDKRMNNPKVIEIKLYLEQERMTVIDHLTGLYNKRYFDEASFRLFNQARRHNRIFSVVVIDIDDFKKINDEFGHPMGDEVLKNLGKIILGNIRKEDIACRTGGEEFTLLLSDTSAPGAVIVAEKIRIEFNKETLRKKNLSFSGGISSFPEDSLTLDDLVLKADKAMYKSKFSGKNRIS